MCTKWTRASLLIIALAAPSAWAEPADPATKTLPASAAETARTNAFGAQGARMKAAHQAARAAAAQQAQAIATRGQPADLVRPSATATSHANAAGIEHGFTRAAAGAANGQGTTRGRR
jgi:hypothetical protein